MNIFLAGETGPTDGRVAARLGVQQVLGREPRDFRAFAEAARW